MTSIPLQGNRLHTLTAAVHVAAARGRDLHAAVGRFGFGASVGGTVVGLSLVHGGYAPAAWGWTALLGFWATLLGLVFRSDRRVDRAGVALVAGVAAVAGWTALSSTWTQSVPRTMLELERDLAYVAIAAAVLLLCNAGGRSQLVWGLGGGLVIVIASAVGSYFASKPELDATQGSLLFRPIGYANALGGLVALALPLVIALAVHDARRAVVCAAGASAVVLSIALYLTQNRSGYLAVGVALVVWLSRTNRNAWVIRGARLAAVLVGVAVCRALAGLGDRAQYWRVAWRAFERHPLLGSGAGTFDEQWLRYRGSGVSVRDAHSLYLETLSELGVVGLLLLVVVLALPIVVSRRTRDPLTTACLASYCAFLVHAGFEWDWEMPVVVVSGLPARVGARSRARVGARGTRQPCPLRDGRGRRRSRHGRVRRARREQRRRRSRALDRARRRAGRSCAREQGEAVAAVGVGAVARARRHARSQSRRGRRARVASCGDRARRRRLGAVVPPRSSVARHRAGHRASTRDRAQPSARLRRGPGS